MHNSKSPQYRYMPTPKTCERASSRASSETPFLVTDADPDNLDLSEIMHRKLTEAKANKNQLAEERVISANLRSQLTTVKATCDEQKRHIVELEVAAQSNLENSHLKDRQLSELQLMFDETLSAKESQLEMNTDKDEQIRVGQEKLRCAEEKIRATEDRVTKVKDAAKRGIENMSKNFDALRNAVEHLKTRYEVSVETISKMRDELEAIRLATSNGIKDLEPFMDPSGLHLVKANETRMLIQELQTDRNDAQQVIDFLKDKLHNLSTQLAEANENTVDLENRRREDSNNLARSVNSWETTGRQVEELASKLRQREKEDAELLAEGLKLEIQLSDANDK
ncbi:uncharacterized protein C8R40DRAFT_1187280 [Lentinula edodes]|uniref:uncharacterized protein n=1 Tax=Lentinula edodes TaxID=5353 RepID=UPI001E8ECC45|nr:uncharacterized protein C8R40DRAFT_1187280 [Lentinula edodes]KAH7875884.1 hypothetical protein C8R40DRAFT_1187280 [Lentinula edodes]